MPTTLTRRRFGALLFTAMGHAAFAEAADLPVRKCEKKSDDNAHRKLDFQLEGDFGESPYDNVRAVIRSAAESIWQHCPNTFWQTPGFVVYNSKESPITLYDHRQDGRVAIGLTVQGNFWSQFAYQFAHEFCHALAGHTNDWRKLKIRGYSPNLWFEESLCETASLFALRSMGKSWAIKAPYRNWKSYGASLTTYAEDRLEKTAKILPPDKTFKSWFQENEPAMRKNGVLRENNNLVAQQLLPLFEAEPAGWEAVTFLNLEERKAHTTLDTHLSAWQKNVPLPLRPFVQKVAAVFRH